MILAFERNRGFSGSFHLTSLGYRLLIVCTHPISSRLLPPYYMCTTFLWNSLRSTKSLLPDSNVGETRKLIWYIVWHTKLISGLSDKITEHLTEIPKKSWSIRTNFEQHNLADLWLLYKNGICAILIYNFLKLHLLQLRMHKITVTSLHNFINFHNISCAFKTVTLY
jgi:hypothetical protein